MGVVMVTGEVIVSGRKAGLPGVTVVVRVEESSRADAPSTVIAETILRDPWSGGGPARFILLLPAVNPRATYRVSASADLDGDGDIGLGDFLNVESFPVITHGHGHHAVVELCCVE